MKIIGVSGHEECMKMYGASGHEECIKNVRNEWT
jgi:hypothetical protein